MSSTAQGYKDQFDDEALTHPPRQTQRESVDRMMEEHLDAEAVVESFVFCCMSLCAVMVLYCVIYAFYLVYFVGPPPPPPPF